MLRETLNSDLKQAMRNKEALKRTVLRTMLSEIRNAEINSQTTLDDEGIISVLTKQVQQRKDSVEAYEAANRQDLVEKETAEINIISVYLPEQLPQIQEVTVIIRLLHAPRLPFVTGGGRTFQKALSNSYHFRKRCLYTVVKVTRCSWR